MEDSDSAVIAASLESPGAFGGLFDRHAGTVLRFLLRRVDPAEAEGLLGEVFRIAFERRASFDLTRSCARPWLYGIAGNVLSKHHRGEARRLRATARLAAQQGWGVDPADSSASAVDARILWPRVVEAIAGLSPTEREVLLLFAWEELSYDEMAAVLGVPVGTVRSRLSRGRARLRRLTGGIDPPEASVTAEERTTDD